MIQFIYAFLAAVFYAINILRMVVGDFNEKEAFLNLPIIGIIMFNMLFESRSRYLIAFVPFFLIGATGVFNLDYSRLSRKTG